MILNVEDVPVRRTRAQRRLTDMVETIDFKLFNFLGTREGGEVAPVPE